MRSIGQSFSAIVLAADREAENPVAAAAGVRCKSLASVNGIPMIFRVLGALSASGKIDSVLLCGPPGSIVKEERELDDYLTSGQADWMESQATPSLSAYEALKSQPADKAVLLTTSDHALLSPRVVTYFLDEAEKSGCDVIAAVARRETVMSAYPQTSRTAYRFRDGAYCSCNLFAFITPQSRTVPSFWRQVEQQRKNPFKVISILGWLTVFRYLAGRLTLSDAMGQLSQRLGCRAGVVVMPYPEAAIDVDSAEDLQLVRQIALHK
ncbi:nucleotidyltransferase family protein [Desulfopila aestuarii]|uniref:MobA-like NTP transferase domain-containing protein n=1 Tax=Desulfopila aestuarii DSM 18488 TaxID=1121416 RepID=A0A1M7YGV8_9BACT|nr:nucleotidyltransferase family protein [Desulfopila aestuarii]SHO51862.1 MobA-like NTP transferase domain-containing protein [Desulfopila aestuarii DSM 18488]